LIGQFESDSGDISVFAKGDNGWEELVRLDSGSQYNDFGLDLAMGSGGTLHIIHVYDDEELGRELRLATCIDGSAVTSTAYDSISYGSRPSIAVDSDGHSHISVVADWDVTYVTDTPDNGATTDSAVDAVMKALLVTAAIASVALMAFGVLGLRRFRSWQSARFNEDPEEREERRSG
jgi:multisubunit Na+/H+ antiporter MnhC subunit